MHLIDGGWYYGCCTERHDSILIVAIQALEPEVVRVDDELSRERIDSQEGPDSLDMVFEVVSVDVH